MNPRYSKDTDSTTTDLQALGRSRCFHDSSDTTSTPPNTSNRIHPDTDSWHTPKHYNLACNYRKHGGLGVERGPQHPEKTPNTVAWCNLPTPSSPTPPAITPLVLQSW